MLWYVLGSLAVVFIIRKLLSRRQMSRRQMDGLPPCVPGWPVVGCSPKLDVASLHVQLRDWSKTHGDIFTMWNFGSPSVVVGTNKLVEDVHHLANDRSSQVVHRLVSSGGRDIIQGDYMDPKWLHLRKVTHQALKSYGAMLLDLEGLVQGEVDDFIQALQQMGGKPVEPSEIIRTTLCCIISTLMFGEKLGREHPDIQRMLHIADDFNVILSIGFAMELDYFPWLQHLNIGSMKHVNAFYRRRDHLFDAYLQRFRKDETEGRGGLIHLLLKDETVEPLTDDQIKATFVDFLLGGIETTRATSLAFMLLLLHHREEQEKLQQEIDGVIGRSRSPTLQDQSDMPLLQTALLETLRFLVPVPVTVRCAHQDMEFHGYEIPAKTQFITNLWSVNHDPDFWEDPGQWRPERFRDDLGQILPAIHPNRRRVDLVFGAGKRVCPGKNFAKARLFLLFAALLQQFDLQPDPDGPPPTLIPEEVKRTVTAIVPKYNICFVPRD